MALTAWQYADLTAKIEKKKEAIAKGPDKDSGGSQLAVSWYHNLIAFRENNQGLPQGSSCC